MDQTFDAVKDLSLISEKNWCIKVRILRMWKVPSYEKSYSQPSMELVVIDKDLFEPILKEGKVFVVANFVMDSNTQKFRPTKHSMLIIFKRDTLVSGADDMDIPIESFDFVATKEILSSIKDDLYLIDFVGLLSTKSELIAFENKNRKSHYMKIELDDLRLIRLGSKHSTSVDVIGRVVRHSPSEDFLSLTPYAPIHQIKQTLDYKACRQCTQGLEALTDQFYCAKCDVYSTVFTPRLCIQVRIVDDSDTTTFVLFDNCVSKFLGLSAADIRTRLFARGYEREHFPDELNALIGKTLLFKLTVRHDSLNKFHPCVITVSRICSDPEIISSLALDKNIKLDALQTLTTAADVRSGDLVGSGSILGVPGSTTTPSPKSAAVSGHGATHVVTQTPVKRVWIRFGNDLSSRATLSASKSLLPAFESCLPGNATDPDAGDM
ncbi:Putative PIF1 DNA helicase/replication protein-like protein [Arachis hypogaea]|nr:Putative PIF1 DNA helicase/replication protein-like protein [Arachis hypogaea]